MVFTGRRSECNGNSRSRLRHVKRRCSKDTKTTAETKQTEQKTADSKKANTQDSAFSLESKYFNNIKKVDGLETIQNPENILALVNKEYALPGNYEPSDLVIPDVEFSFEEKIQNVTSERKRPKH